MKAATSRFPPWLKKRLPRGGRMREVSDVLDGLGIHTVCRSARCPNRCECFARGTATFMILGDVCTRHCRFCAVGSGSPLPVDPGEPERVAEAAHRLGLTYVVVTSVTRDDLPDGGAAHFARTVRAVTAATHAPVEVLTPDFQGDPAAVDTVLAAGPAVYNHNVETVPRLYELVRPEARYPRSLGLLRRVAASGTSVPKSGLMVGLGETDDEVYAVLDDLAAAGCEMLTIGQYLRPSPAHRPVERYVEPRVFQRYREAGLRRGLRWIASAPFVRSSYRAEAAFASATTRRETRMLWEVVMPPLGEDAGDECKVSFWHVEVGEAVRKDDSLVEMTTDKAVFDVPAPHTGTLAEVFAGEDDAVKVGQKIAVIETAE